MAAGAGGSASSNQPPFSHQAAPKILLAKPALAASVKFNRGVGTAGGGGAGPDGDSAGSVRSRLPPIGSLNLLSDSWDFHSDRFLPFLTDNTEFTVVGVIGPPGAGKSTIMNEIYGFDASSPGMLPPFAIESEETKAMAKHCTVGIEPRISSERIILLDTQPVFSSSVLAEIIRSDGSSAIPVVSGVSLSAELAYELLSIQLGVLLVSICHIIVVVSEGVHDASMWKLMSTVDLLKHGIPDPSSVTFSHSQGSTLGFEKEKKDKMAEAGKEYMAVPVFVHTKVRDQDITMQNSAQLKKALARHIGSSSFMKLMGQNSSKENICPCATIGADDVVLNSGLLKLFLVPSKISDESSRTQQESYISVLRKLRDSVLSMSNPTFSRTVSERDWLKNSSKIWDIIKTSSLIAEYYRILQSSGMFRR